MKNIHYFIALLMLLAASGCVPAATPAAPACTDAQAWPVHLDSPAEGQVVSEDSPELHWTYDDRCVPDAYAFAVLDGYPDGNTVLDGTTASPQPNFDTPLPFLQDCQVYYWWVKPIIGGEVIENEIPGYFVTDFTGSCPGVPCILETLAAPVPLTPANGAAWTQVSPSVTWEYPYPACLSTVTFHIEIARDEQFADLLVYGDNKGWMVFDPAAAQMQDCTTYYWHVAAAVDGKLGPYSETFSFHTDFAGTCPGGPCDVASLAAPTPVSPENGALWTGTFPIVTWDYPYPACESSIMFHAKIARDAEFTESVVESFNIPGSSDTFDPAAATLEDCSTYYWHVAASTANGEGPFSETYTFRTDYNGTCKRTATAPKDAACYGGPGSLYPLKGILNAGEEVELLGRSDNALWLVINRSGGYGSCWVETSRLENAGDTGSLPVEFTPPLPTATTAPTQATVSCSSYTDETSCYSAGCAWNQNMQQCLPKP